MAVATGALERAQWPAERKFFLSMTIAIAVVVFVGFSRSFFLSPLFPGWPAPPEHFYRLHGAAFATWFVLLLVQASLISGRQVALHRRLGVAGACLAALMVGLGIVAAVIGASRPTGYVGIPLPPLMFLAVPLFEIVLFAVLMTLAIVNRNKPQTHKRLVLIASVSLISAAFARWPVIAAGGPIAFFACSDLFLLALVVWDRKSLGHLHPATKWAGSAVVLSQPLRLAVAGTPVWLAFAHWIVGLGG